MNKKVQKAVVYMMLAIMIISTVFAGISVFL
ncbi:MAG TPA: stressosome-associated protein Prli42 [Chondromyces sp.]|nr:stressosome-associated protein Prli42 [Chondromyces sp.]